MVAAKSKVEARQRVWAVGIKGWVELRSHPRAPRLLTTKARVRVKEEIPVPGTGTWTIQAGRYEMVGRKFKTQWRNVTLTSSIHEGGRVLKTLPRAKVLKLTRLSVGDRMCVEVPKEFVEKLVGKELGSEE